MASSRSIHSSSNFHHVFFSSCVEDPAKRFVGSLYRELQRRGFLCFKSNGKLDDEKQIPSEVIRCSSFSVVIISQDYVSSNRCLDELAEIIQCREANGLFVLPIFYNVDSGEITEKLGLDMVKKLGKSLTEVSLIDGWNYRDWSDEQKLIEEVANFITGEWIHHVPSGEFNGLIGIDSRIERILSLLDMDSPDVLFLGIWGMGGIGKTTIAKALFNRVSTNFEAVCFVNVSEELEKLTITRLREQVLSKILEEKRLNLGMHSVLPRHIMNRLRRKRVLIVLDSVSDAEQSSTLAGDRSWFGPGSRIIITSRDKQVLMHNAGEIYEIKGLNYHESLQLLSLKAFKQIHPIGDYVKLSQRFVDYTKGVPLAVNVLGSFLCNKQEQEWEITLEKLEESPNLEVQKVLKISYDGLEQLDKDIFLDIASFFRGYDVDSVIGILDGCDFFPSSGISRLIDKSLLEITDNKLHMHDLLREMGQDIVRQESNGKPGECSRIWDPEDVYHVLTTNKGSIATEGIFLDISKTEKVKFSPAAFSLMCNLRLLKFYQNSTLSWKNPYGFISELMVESVDGLQSLPNKLCYFHWHGYPWECLPSNFYMENLVQLNMPFSQVKELWHGVKHLRKLKQIDLHDSVNLTRLPDLSSALNLERIVLDNCTSLLEIHSSVQCLHQLAYLSLSNCKELQSLPSLIRLESLRTLKLSSCSNLKEFPEVSGFIEELHLDGTRLEEWPSSIRFLDRLRILSLDNCEYLKTLPSSIHLNSLDTLDLSSCSSLEKFPEVKGNIKHLSLKYTGIEELPSSIGSLSSLVKLNLKGTAMKELPLSIGNLTSLVELNLKESSMTELPSSFGCLTSLVKLNLAVASIEELPSSIGHLSSLVDFNLEKSSLTALPSSIGYLTSLVKLNLAVTEIDELPLSIGNLSSLIELNLSQCPRLGSLPNSIGELKCLEKLYLCGLRRLKTLPRSICQLQRLQDLYLNHCKNLCKLPPLSGFVSLRDLVLSYTGIIKIPSSLGHLSSLQVLLIKSDNFMRIPECINRLFRLEVLDISYCKRLKSLPELPPRIKTVVAHNCTALRTVSNPFIQLQESTEQPPLKKFGFTFANCVSLEKDSCGYILENTFLKIQCLATALQEHSTRDGYILVSPVVCFPGSEVPRCFGYQNVGASIVTLLSPHWYDTKLVGFTFCAVIELENRYYCAGFTFECNFRLENEYGDILEFCSKESGEWGNQFEFEMDHVFFWNTSCVDILTEQRYNRLRDTSCRATFEYEAYLVDEFEVTLPSGASKFEVKSCGFNPVYAKDKKETNFSTDQQSSCNDSMLIFSKDLARSFGEQVMGINSNKKRSNYKSDKDEPVEEKEQPHHKKMK